MNRSLWVALVPIVAGCSQGLSVDGGLAWEDGDDDWMGPTPAADDGAGRVGPKWGPETAEDAVVQAGTEGEPCEGDNYEFPGLTGGFAGGAMVGIEWTPRASARITRIELFTGGVAEEDAVGIWSDDGGSPGRPEQALGYSAPFTTAVEDSWQGGDLVDPVDVTAGTRYWVVWDPTGGESTSVTDDAAAIQQVYWGNGLGTVAGGGRWDGPYSFEDHRWKFRMFCGAAEDSWVALAVRPGSCPTPLPCQAQGVLPVAVLGSPDFDVTDVDLSSLLLEGVPPIRWAFEDVGASGAPSGSATPCDECGDAPADGIADLTLKFDNIAVVEALGVATDRECVVLTLTGATWTGAPIHGADAVRYQCP